MNLKGSVELQAYRGTMLPSAVAQEPMAGVSRHYQFMSTAEIVQELGRYGWSIESQMEATVRQGPRSGKQRHMLVFGNPEYASDQERLLVVVRNSHDARGALEIFYGVYRGSCSNQLYRLGLEDGQQIRIIHKTTQKQRFQEAIPLVLGGLEELALRIAAMKKKILTPEQIGSYAREALAERYGTRIPEIRVEQLLQVRRPEDEGNSAWLVMNRVQEALVRGGDRYTQGEKIRVIRSLRSVKRLPEFNNALWELAETV